MPVSSEGNGSGRKPKRLVSFRDLEVYQSSYTSMIRVAKEIIPHLPPSEKFDLIDQVSRSSKAIPRLIAEGYAKRHQRLGFQKYLDDAMAESNETIVSLEQAKDLYHVPMIPAQELIDEYDKIGRQLYNLAKAWSSFGRNGPNRYPDRNGPRNPNL